jgi:hypothetical protein
MDVYDNHRILVGSDYGGLFKSDDEGTTWRQVNGLPLFHIEDILCFGNTILVSGAANMKKNSTSLWRSTDGGETWSNPQSLLLPNDELNNGGGFFVQSTNIVIGSGRETQKIIWWTCAKGIASSLDLGATWSYLQNSPPNSLSIYVYANNPIRQLGQSNVRVILVQAKDGLYRSINGGVFTKIERDNDGQDIQYSWSVRCFTSIPAASTASTSTFPNIIIITNSAPCIIFAGSSKQPYYSIDYGNTFIKMENTGIADGSGNSARQPYIKYNKGVLYYGNRETTYKRNVIWNGSSLRYADASWSELNCEHSDHYDILFNRDNTGAPKMIASDGGILKWDAISRQFNSIGSKAVGLNALMIYSLASQYIADQNRLDVYFGTQDNYFWYSSDGGNSWNQTGYVEGGMFQMNRLVENDSKSLISFHDAMYNLTRSHYGIDSSLTPNNGYWNNASNINDNFDHSGISYGMPYQILNKCFIQLAHISSDLNIIAFTENAGVTWSELYRTDKQVSGLAGMDAQIGFTADSHVKIYIPYTEENKTKLICLNVEYDIDGDNNMHFHSLSVESPNMNNFNGMSQFGWYGHYVYSVCPNDPQFIIAADILSQQMKMSADGGNNWTPMDQLTELMVENGSTYFYRGNTEFVQPHVIKFNPENSNDMLIGTEYSGILYSTSKGSTWTKIESSEQVTNITDIDWPAGNQGRVALIATLGRGIWKIVF